MKKLLLVLLIGFLGFSVSCTPNPTRERSVGGKVLSTGEITFNDFDGNFIVWENPLADSGTGESGSAYRVWFIYPRQELPKTSFTMQLTYKWIQRGIPVVHVLSLKINQ